MTGDGRADIITGTTREGGPVRVFTIGGPGSVTELTSFFPYFDAFRGPVRVAAADVNGDGQPEIITGAGPGGGPHVRALGLAGGVLTESPASTLTTQPSATLSTAFLLRSVATVCTSAAPTSPATASPRFITGTNRAAGPLRVFQIPTPGNVIELTNFFPYFPAFLGPVRVTP